MLAVLAQDPDSGIINYGDTSIKHKNQSDVVLEFLDFYRAEGDNSTLRYLVFDSKFTPYANLKKLDEACVKFITIRRRGKSIVKHVESAADSQRKKVRVMTADGKGRTLTVLKEQVNISDYGNPIRQLAITGHGKIKPALIITNDFETSIDEIIRKYTRRWLVEKTISEQIEFFHLNRVSSFMVIKVDFDLVMTILANNVYRIFAKDFDGYAHQASTALYEKFIVNQANIKISGDEIHVHLQKKRDLPVLLQYLETLKEKSSVLLGNRKIVFHAATSS